MGSYRSDHLSLLTFGGALQGNAVQVLSLALGVTSLSLLSLAVSLLFKYWLIICCLCHLAVYYCLCGQHYPLYFFLPHGQGFHYNICLLSNGLLSHVTGFFSQILEGWLSTQVCKLYLGMRSVYAAFILCALKLKEGAGSGVLESRSKRKRGRCHSVWLYF